MSQRASLVTWLRPGAGTPQRRPSWLAGRMPPSPVSPIETSLPPPRLPSLPPSIPAPTISAFPRSLGDSDVIFAPRVIPSDLVPRGEIEHRDAELAALKAELEQARASNAALATALATERRRVLEASEPALVGLALAIAKRAVGGALAIDPSPLAGWAREAIDALPPKATFVVAVASDVADRVPESAWEEARLGGHELVRDPSLAPGTCEIRSGATTIEVGAAARLGAVGEAIGAEP